MSAPVDASLEDAVERLRRLLSQEAQEETRQSQEALAGRPLAELEADGLLCCHLHVREESAGPAGLWRLVLARADGVALPRLALSPGEPVALGGPAALASATRQGAVRGTVERADKHGVRVLVDSRDADDLDDEKLAVWPLPSPVTMDRMQSALSAALRSKGDERTLVEVLLGVRSAPTPKVRAAIPPEAASLHPAQQEAVVQALSTSTVSLIHGPPGTGKTRTCAAVAAAAIREGQRVLLCAASNGGADELARALGRVGVDVLRVGHPARVDEALHPWLLSERVANHPRAVLARDLIRLAENLRTRSGASRKKGGEARAERMERKAEWRAMLADARTYTAQAEEEVLRRSRAVVSTLAGAGGMQLASESFDLLILDEASQASTPLALVALPRASRVVLAGDHRQLPPTVLSPAAARGGLAATVFERLMETPGVPGAMLTEQHRMHADLMAFPNVHEYGGLLTAHPACAARDLAARLGRPVNHPDLQPVWQWVDTAGTGFSDELPPGGTSHRNPGEASLCAALVRQLLEEGVAPSEVAVVVPYRAQVDLLSTLLGPLLDAGVEVDSVDGFQGREKDAVVLSLTRSNERGEMGFVEDRRRLNVALTRARCLLRVVGDSGTVGIRGTGEALLAHAMAQGAHISAYALACFSEVSS